MILRAVQWQEKDALTCKAKILCRVHCVWLGAAIRINTIACPSCLHPPHNLSSSLCSHVILSPHMPCALPHAGSSCTS